MELSLASFGASSIALTLLLYVIKLIITKTSIVLKYGIVCLYIFIVLILIRGYLPFDFYAIHLTTSYYSHKILPFLQTILYYRLNLFFITVTIEKLLITCWIAGSLLLIYKKINQYVVFKKHLHDLTFCVDKETAIICRNVFYSIFSSRKKYKIRIIQSDILGTPAIFGFFYPIIILPVIKYTKEELKFIFYHELIHYKHNDFLIKLAANFLVSIHWWNLLIYRHLFYVINQVQELYVDYEVNKNLTKSDKIIYLNVLSKSIEHTFNKKLKKECVYTLVDNHSNLIMLQRLECIINFPKKGFTFKGVAISFFLFMLSFTFVFEPSFSPTQDELGEPIFYEGEKPSYYIWNGNDYELYLNGVYVYNSPSISEHFIKLPIYNQEESK